MERPCCLRCLARTSLAEPTSTDEQDAAALGRGGMGVDFRVREPGPDRVVALKMLLFGGWGGSALRERFRAEAAAASALEHAGIVRVLKVGEHEGQPFLAMEYLPGGSLAGRMGEGPFAAREAAGYLAAVARAIQ